MAQHTIQGTVGMNTQPAVNSLNQLTQHGKNFGTSFSKLFAQEPLGERRMRGAFTGIIQDLTSARSGAEAGAMAFGRLAHALSLGAGVGLGLGLVATGLEKAVARGEELRKIYADLGKSAHEADREARLSTAQEGVEQLGEKAKKTAHTMRQFRDQEKKESGLSGALRSVTRTATEFVEHPDELLSKRNLAAVATAPVTFGASLTQLRGSPKRLQRERSETEEQKKSVAQDLADLDIKRVRSGELRVEQQRLLLEGSDKEKRDLQISSEYETRRAAIEANRTGSVDKVRASLEKEFQLRRKIADIEDQSTKSQLDQERALADLRQAGLTGKQEAIAIAQQEFAGAKAQQRLARGPEAQQKAETAAKSAATQQAGAEAGGIEAGGAEREMSPQDQQKQYQDRLKKFYGIQQELTHRGMSSDVASPPRIGEAEYDPLAKFKGARARGLSHQKDVENEFNEDVARRSAGVQPVETEPVPGGRKAGVGESQASVNEIERNRIANEASSQQQGVSSAPKGWDYNTSTGDYVSDKMGFKYNVQGYKPMAIPDIPAPSKREREQHQDDRKLSGKPDSPEHLANVIKQAVISGITSAMDKVWAR